MRGPCCEKPPQLLVGDTGLCSMGAFEYPPLLPWPGDPSSSGGGGREAGRFPQATLASPRACAGAGRGTGRAFVRRGAVGGCGLRDGHRAPLCAAVSRAGCGIGPSRGDGELVARDEERWPWMRRRSGDGEQRPARVEGGAGRCVHCAGALCKHVNLFSFLPRLSG